jgi:hypothetical protein
MHTYFLLLIPFANLRAIPLKGWIIGGMIKNSSTVDENRKRQLAEKKNQKSDRSNDKIMMLNESQNDWFGNNGPAHLSTETEGTRQTAWSHAGAARDPAE